MKKKQIAIIAAAVAALAVAGAGMYWLGAQRAVEPLPATTGSAAPSPTQGGPQSIAEGEEATRRHLRTGVKAGDVDPANGRKVLYYHDPMVPGNRFDKPAKSPFMDMMLVPVYADGGADQGRVTVSPRIQQNLGVRTALVTESMLSPQLAAVGAIAFNEREQAVIQARASGFVERLHVRATFDRVTRGQALAELYVPDWVAAQQEYLAVRRLQGADIAPLVDGAKSRMRLAGMTEEQIRGIEASGRPNPRTTVIAPAAGLVTERAWPSCPAPLCSASAGFPRCGPMLKFRRARLPWCGPAPGCARRRRPRRARCTRVACRRCCPM
jgi:membrane fusion protein, copper/silver efflux system